MHDNNLKTEEELQSWFIHDMERFFNGKGKEMIGWDEIIEGGLSKTATVMWWRSWVKDAATKATAQGNPVIFTPNGQFYLDYAEDKNSMASIYNLDTTDNLTPEQQSLILGVQGNIWCEWIPSNARMQYMAIPRLLAIAELGWSKPEQKTGMPSNNACLISLNVSISWVSITVYPIWKALMPSTPLSVKEPSM